MIYFLKKYWKLIFFAFSIIIIGSITLISNKNDIKIESEKKLSDENNILREKKDKEDNNDILLVDIKGAIQNPGVYQLNVGKRVIDVINLAGGLKENANTINLNLSKKITDEMYIIVYTNEELESYLKKENNASCVSLECICPNEENKACITSKDSIIKKTNDIKQDVKISINNASKEELMTLTGIGEAKADNIINYRNENGLFNKIEDIKNVAGISDKIFEKIKNDIEL